MIPWIAVGLILLFVVAAFIILRVRRKPLHPKASRPAPSDPDNRPKENDEVAQGDSPGMSATRWLRSLVKADDKDRAGRGENRY